MEPNRDKNHKNPKKPEGDRPKGGYITPLMIALVLVLAFSWVSNICVIPALCWSFDCKCILRVAIRSNCRG